jgi:exodeoxyribonuclease-3
MEAVWTKAHAYWRERESIMKLISWNVNGIRSALSKGFAETFDSLNADIFCLQEVRALPEQVDYCPEGYERHWHAAEKKGYSGTAVFCKTAPVSVSRDIPDHTGEGRILTLEFQTFYLVNLYSPNSQNDLKRLDYRIQWEKALCEYLSGLSDTKPVVVCGDMNVAHEEIDLARPKTNHMSAGFTDSERECFSNLLRHDFLDTFRTLYPDKTDAYSWWSHQAGARSRNVGWRIDYFLTSSQLRPLWTDAGILPDVLGSDHCPVWLELNL